MKKNKDKSKLKKERKSAKRELTGKLAEQIKAVVEGVGLTSKKVLKKVNKAANEIAKALADQKTKKPTSNEPAEYEAKPVVETKGAVKHQSTVPATAKPLRKPPVRKEIILPEIQDFNNFDNEHRSFDGINPVKSSAVPEIDKNL